MKKIIIFILINICIVAFAGYHIKIKSKPNIWNVAMIDLYNSNTYSISDIKIICNKGHNLEEYIIDIPIIEAGERDIVVFSTAIAGIYDTGVYLIYNGKEYEIAGLEKGYTGMHKSIQIENDIVDKMYYWLPTVPNWNKIYYFNNIGEFILSETRSENRSRIGYSADKTTRIMLIAEETLTDEAVKMLVEDFKRVE